MKFQRIYNCLKAFGFSAPKAAEIVLDARRKDDYARRVVALAVRARRQG